MYWLVKPFVAALTGLRDRLDERLQAKGIHLPERGSTPMLDPEGWNPAPTDPMYLHAQEQDDDGDQDRPS